MHLFFIDESGSLSPIGKHGSEDNFVLGGIIISEDPWFKINTDLKTVAKKIWFNSNKIGNEGKVLLCKTLKFNALSHRQVRVPYRYRHEQSFTNMPRALMR